MRLPTVTLRRASDGKEIKVDRAKYAVNLMAYAAKGYRLRTEARGEAPDSHMAFQLGQAEIERDRQEKREAPKNFEKRKIEVRPLDDGTVDDGTVEEAHVTEGGDKVELTPAERNMPRLTGRKIDLRPLAEMKDLEPKKPEPPQEAQEAAKADDPPAAPKKPATRAARGRRKAS